MVNVKGNIAEFTFYRPNAQKVSLSGQFNNWRTDNIKMVRNERGYWTIKLRLPIGRFKFRYCSDGEWFADYAAFGVVPSRFGMDSIVKIASPHLAIPKNIAPKQTEEVVAA